MRQQSLTSLRDRNDKSGSLNASNASRAITLIVSAYDTLALREIVIGATKNDLTRDRCARAFNLLMNAYNIEKDAVIEAHRNLHESVCPN